MTRHECRPKKWGVCLRMPKARDGVASPGGVGTLFQMRMPSRIDHRWFAGRAVVKCSLARAILVLLCSR